jgi:hypothetical protein
VYARLYPDEGLFEQIRATLVRVSIKDARWLDPVLSVPIPQEHLVEFFKKAPNLEWFRSDLTPENVTVLREERPGVVFAS